MQSGERLSTKIRVRPLEPEDSLAHITGLLHRAYKQHADKGIKALAAFQPEEMTRKRVAGGECYVALYLGKIVGTILFRPPGAAGAERGWLFRGWRGGELSLHDLPVTHLDCDRRSAGPPRHR